MKYMRIIWRNCTRNKRRTILTILSIGFSLFLVSFLRTLIIELTRADDTPTSIRRLVVRRSTSLQEDMPESYRRKIEAVPHVEKIVAMDWFGGIYKEPKNFFANFAMDHENFFQVFPEIKLDEANKQAFFAQRSAAFCGVKLAERFGWKVGDKITLLGSIYPIDLEFTLVGIYTSEVDERTVYFRRDYFQESLGNPGKVGVFYALVHSPEDIPGVIQAVDGMFRNTDAETLTETERAWDRRLFCGDEYHVFRGFEPDPRNRNLEGPGILEGQHPPFVLDRGCPAGLDRGNCGMHPGPAGQRNHHGVVKLQYLQ